MSEREKGSLKRVLEEELGLKQGLAEALSGAAAGRETAIVEIAGRDSYAAAVFESERSRIDFMVPTISRTGTEYGTLTTLLENAEMLKKKLRKDYGVESSETAVLGSPRWWHVSCGRWVSHFQSVYGFSPICVSCHMYLHATRIPLALMTGAKRLVSGERLSHGGRAKINQTRAAVLAYKSVAAEFGMELLTPLLHISDGTAVEELIDFEWPESGRQMRCVLEGNYLSPDGSISFQEEALAAYLEEFLVPFTVRVLEIICREGRSADYEEIALETIRGRRG